jgi:hypothetical protein
MTTMKDGKPADLGTRILVFIMFLPIAVPSLAFLAFVLFLIFHRG